ncbi:unnamed protein product [Sphenostylis stenocarpa]|uniref:Uncharacterized protein n=1 Tax=Sphenostylis stenocarpa TaxID=92480 RepID=A0AA86SJ21_9FABA|nr:unnamed protein product [Sphenostylis stenocarpa]
MVKGGLKVVKTHVLKRFLSDGKVEDRENMGKAVKESCHTHEERGSSALTALGRLEGCPINRAKEEGTREQKLAENRISSEKSTGETTNTMKLLAIWISLLTEYIYRFLYFPW